MAPEFSHIVKMDEIGSTPQKIALIASDAERAALATRFDLITLDELQATLSLSKSGDIVALSGTYAASLSQSCIATGDPVPANLRETVQINFIPEPKIAGGESEIELTADDVDVIFHDGRTVDVGEAIAQSLALALDPYPRSAIAEQALRAAGVKSEEEARLAASPFAGLAGLKGND